MKSGWSPWIFLMFSGPVWAGTLVDLSAEASRPAVNDLIRANLYAEASDTNPAELARKINADMAQAILLAKGRPGVQVRSGGQHSYPVYAQNRKLEGWRMRSELVIESRDTAAVSDLIGRLQQQRLLLGSVQQLPAPETRRQVEDEATREALKAFESRAQLVAGALGKTFRIRQLNIQQSGSGPVPIPMARGALLAAEAMPAPLEGGTTALTTAISGQIELGD